MYNIQVLITDRSSLPLPLLRHGAGDLPWLPQLGGEAADVADGLQDDVQLGHIVLDAHTRYQALQSGMRNRILDQDSREESEKMLKRFLKFYRKV